MTARVALVGIHGHGSSYLDRIERCASAELVAVVDPRPPAAAIGTARWYPGLDELLADSSVDVVIIATPIDTHRQLAVTAMQNGCDVLLEKPTASSLADFRAIAEASATTERLCQVGFQTYGSYAVDLVRDTVESGEIGPITGVGAVGTWVRTAGYWDRAPWAGRRRLAGREVVDGVVTNPLAHAIATGLLLIGATREEHVADVRVDLFHANDIEADDTSSGVVRTVAGHRLGFGVTLCAPTRSPARIVVMGEKGELRLAYESDTVELRGADKTWQRTLGRIDLLDDLLTARSSGAPLRCAVEDTGAFMQVLEAVRRAEDPAPIDPSHVAWLGDGADRHPVVADVEAWCERAALQGRTFTELEAPFTS